MNLKVRPALIVFDFDGVLTDNRVLVFSDGKEAVFCSRADGLGFDMFRWAKQAVLILSTEKNEVVSARASKLKIPCLQGIRDKAQALKDYCVNAKVSLADVLYIGNDLNDYEPMQLVGLRACPADAHPQIKKISQYILNSNGGYGVAREVCEDLCGLEYSNLLNLRD